MADYLLTYARKYAKNYEGLPRACWNGIILIGVNAFTIGICFFLSLYFVNTKHYSPSIAGLLLSCYGMGTVSGGIIAGKLSDKFSLKWISVISLFGQSCSFFLLIYLESAMILIPNLFLLGFSAYGFKTSNSVWILNQCKQDSKTRYKTISISHVASNLGLGLSGFIISFMAQFGFQSIFYLSGILLLFSAMYVLFQISDDYIINRNRQDQKLAPLATSKTIIVTLSCVFLVGLIIAQLGSTYPLYIQESFPKLGIHAVSTLFILDTFLIVFFQAPLTSYLSNQNKFFITGFGALLMGTGMLILIYATTFSIAIFSCVIWTTGEMLFISTAQLLCYEGSKEHKKGQNLGLFQTVFASSNIIGPVVGGTIYHYMGGNILWYCSAVIGVLCCFICLNMGRAYTNTSS